MNEQGFYGVEQAGMVDAMMDMAEATHKVQKAITSTIKNAFQPPAAQETHTQQPVYTPSSADA